jgi:hypothetical protein
MYGEATSQHNFNFQLQYEVELDCNCVRRKRKGTENQRHSTTSTINFTLKVELRMVRRLTLCVGVLAAFVANTGAAAVVKCVEGVWCQQEV